VKPRARKVTSPPLLSDDRKLVGDPLANCCCLTCLW